ncbi:MAG: thioredoxin family protein [Candidatus Thermoplasmatota archaeon]|jgi:thiol-disulfide isomerase/thioredoxin|nr:thioredoxin family protein [Candidatus Thermoplasmatota archaeon]
MESVVPSDFTGNNLGKSGDWVVCFGAEWCGFCRAFRPKFEKLEGQVKGTLAWADVSDSENPLWESFHLEVIPTVVVFRGGAVHWRRDGKSMRGLSDGDITDIKAATL